MMDTLDDTLTSSGSGLAGRRVLVVEDESMVTMLLQDFLEDMGCEVAGVASRLQEALETIESATFDVARLQARSRSPSTTSGALVPGASASSAGKAS